MPTTRLFIECPNCHTQYLIKDQTLRYSNGAHIQNVADAPEWQQFICPCRSDTPYRFKMADRFQPNENRFKVNRPA
jgi:hypothetical protein